MVIFSQRMNVRVADGRCSTRRFERCTYADCDAVNVDSICLLTNLLMFSTNGIGVTSRRNVTIESSDIQPGCALTNTGYDHHFELPGFTGGRQACESASNCNLQSYSSGIRTGFLGQNVMRNVNVNNCNSANSMRCIGIFLRDNGSLENLLFNRHPKPSPAPATGGATVSPSTPRLYGARKR